VISRTRTILNKATGSNCSGGVLRRIVIGNNQYALVAPSGIWDYFGVYEHADGGVLFAKTMWIQLGRFGVMRFCRWFRSVARWAAILWKRVKPEGRIRDCPHWMHRSS
jgi:hypothetical protein